MKKTFTSIIIAFLFITPLSKLFSQQTLTWENLNSFASVQCMLDLDTAVLVGTNAGIASISTFNGQVFYFNSSNSGLQGDTIFALDRDTSGNIWMGTNCGLFKYTSGNWTKYTTANSILTCNEVTALYFNELYNSLWIGLRDGYVIRKHDTTWKNIKNANGYHPGSAITCFVTDLSGYTWAGTTMSGAYHWEGAKWHLHDPSNSLIDLSVKSIAIDNDRTIWVLNNHNLVSYNDTIWSSYFIPWCGMSRHITVDTNNVVWLTGDCGLLNFDGAIWKNKSQPFGLPTSDFTWHTMKANSIWWMGTKDNGVEQLSGSGILNFSLENSIIHPAVKAIAFQNSPDKTWLAYETDSLAPVSSFDGSTWQHFSSANSSLTAEKITSIAISPTGTIWVGTLGNGLYRKQGNSWTNFNASNSSIIENFITALTINSLGNILIGLKSGSVQVSSMGGYATIFPGMLVNSRVNCLFQSSNLNTWILSESSGIFRMSASGYTAINTSNSGLPSDHVYDIKEDALHYYWIATDSGIGVFDGNNIWITIDTANSNIPSNQITCISISNDSSIWIGTRNSGVSRYYNSEWINYDKCNSSLVSNDILDIETAPDGKVYIGTKNGLSVVTIDYITGQVQFEEPSSINIYPNPASDKLHFEFLLPGAQKGELKIYNAFGQLILSKGANFGNQGKFEFTWDIKNSSTPIQAGLYFYTLQGNFKSQSGKLIIVD